MTVGLSAANLAHSWLNTLRNTASPAIATPFVQLHTADPGASGTTGVSVGSTTRVAITWAAPSAGAMAMTGTAPLWTNGGTSETLSHISFWSASTAGTFYASAVLAAPQAWASTNQFTLTAQGWSITPIAA